MRRVRRNLSPVWFAVIALCLFYGTAFADPYVDEHDLSIGDAGPAGGLIFCVNPDADTDGWKYLEVSPLSPEWRSGLWEVMNQDLGTRTVIGEGKENTAKIGATVTDQPERNAAYLCDTLEVDANGGTFDDWFLPSFEELKLL